MVACLCSKISMPSMPSKTSMPSMPSMPSAARFRTYLFCATLLFQTILIGLSAGFVDGEVGAGYASSIAALVFSCMQTFWLLVILLCTCFFPGSVLCSVLVDLLSLTFFLILGTGTAAGASGALGRGHSWDYYYRGENVALHVTEVVFGWIVNCLNLTALIFIAAYALARSDSGALRSSVARLERGIIRLPEDDEASEDRLSFSTAFESKSTSSNSSDSCGWASQEGSARPSEERGEHAAKAVESAEHQDGHVDVEELAAAVDTDPVVLAAVPDAEAIALPASPTSSASSGSRTVMG